jgi:spermidine synthase
MPKHAVCAEVGILHGDFSDWILRVTEPKKLHLIDIAPSTIESAQERFRSEISAKRVQLHLGDSAAILSSLPDKYFDWLYIDGGHSYAQVKADLAAARQRLVPEGLIALNDYTFFSPNEFIKYGVVEAIHDFCLEHDFEWVFFALEGRLYNDVVLRKIQGLGTSDSRAAG